MKVGRISPPGKPAIRLASTPVETACLTLSHAPPRVLDYRSASRTSLSQNSTKLTPAAAALCGTRLSAVIPGSVFASRQ